MATRKSQKSKSSTALSSQKPRRRKKKNYRNETLIRVAKSISKKLATIVGVFLVRYLSISSLENWLEVKSSKTYFTVKQGNIQHSAIKARVRNYVANQYHKKRYIFAFKARTDSSSELCLGLCAFDEDKNSSGNG